MTEMRQFMCNAVIHWDDRTPLKWTMTETQGKGNERRTVSLEFDLTPLKSGYELAFLLDLKHAMIERRRRVVLITIERELTSIRSLFSKILQRGLIKDKVSQIDLAFLQALRTIAHDVPREYLKELKRFHANNRDNSRIFNPSLDPNEFPLRATKRGLHGDRIDRILSQALTRPQQANILKISEDAYEKGSLDIGHYSFINLAMHAYCRPNSYRKITLDSLIENIDKETGLRSYVLMIPPSKTGIFTPTKIPYTLNNTVGELLAMQRRAVVEKYGHIVAKKDLQQLALFPARKLRANGSWLAKDASQNFGQLPPGSFKQTYLFPINSQTGIPTTFNGLRHTVGTQLAAAGCTAQTIAAVLRHASDLTCQAYVDISFEGSINRLSAGLEPGFKSNFPVYELFRSKAHPIEGHLRIDSEDIESGQIELTGECGRIVACQYAPLACYECPRFIPCYDSDHSINLHIIDREIIEYETKGQAFTQMAEKCKHIRKHILIAIEACKHKLQMMEAGNPEGRE